MRSAPAVAFAEVAAQNAINLADVALGHTVQGSEQVQHCWVSQTVEDKFCLPP